MKIFTGIVLPSFDSNEKPKKPYYGKKRPQKKISQTCKIFFIIKLNFVQRNIIFIFLAIPVVEELQASVSFKVDKQEDVKIELEIDLDDEEEEDKKASFN